MSRFCAALNAAKRGLFSHLGPTLLPLVGKGVDPLFSHSYYFKHPFVCRWEFSWAPSTTNRPSNMDGHGFTKRSSPAKKATQFRSRIAPSLTATDDSAAFPTTAARDLLSASSSSSAMLIDDPTVSSTPSASSSGSAMQIAAPSDTRDLGSASSAASAMQIAAPSVPQPTPSSSAAQVPICFSYCSTPPTAHVPDALTHLTHRTH